PKQLDTVLAVVPKGIGLTPDVESSVAPNGIPVNPTGGAGPMPSGEVTPSGAGRAPPFPLTCAAALPQPLAANNSEIINDLIISRSRQDRSKAEAHHFLPSCALPCTCRGSLCLAARPILLPLAHRCADRRPSYR